MTRKEAKEMLPIIQAFANEETIECNSEINPDKWYMVDKDDDELKFDRSPESYRIKNKCKNRPEQRSSIWEEIPCFDCCFGNKNTGDCEAPQEIIELNEPCGYEFHSTAYIYEEVDEK